MIRAQCLMVQGTASSVGKSMTVAALCRILRQDGFRVAPFKAQNMALNSAVTADGLEIGRAQAVQAEAAGVVAIVQMNPILLKPEADNRSQVVVLGKPVDVLAARDYYARKDALWPVVLQSLEHLRAQYDVIVIEGAGSPAEVNIKDDDIVNMRVAKSAQAPVLLVGDIDRGGVFASLLGTLELLEPEERALVKGLVINKFRGDVSLLESGLRFIEQRTAKPVLGVIPYFRDVALADEDSVALDEPGHPLKSSALALDVAVIRWPHIANFDDFDPLRQEHGVAVRYVTGKAGLGNPDLLILPGTKTTIADLRWLREQGLAQCVLDHAQCGTAIIGICGGYQMLGESLADPLGVEGSPETVFGLGLLPVATTFSDGKTTCQVEGRVVATDGLLEGMAGIPVSGYEIHMGQTEAVTGAAGHPAHHQSAFEVMKRSGKPASDLDGVVCRNVLGTYLHGLFDSPALRRAILRALAAKSHLALPLNAEHLSRQQMYDRLAGHVRASLDIRRIYRLAGLDG